MKLEGNFFIEDNATAHPDQLKARDAVNNAVKSGKAKKPDKCSKCNTVGPVGAHHHKGYDEANRLNVQWLCRTCHNTADAKQRKKKKKDTDNRVDFVEFSPVPTTEEGKQAINDVLYKKLDRTPEGYLEGRAVVTNVGVFPYRMDDGTVRWELRPPEEVFNADSLKTLTLQPITNNHPTEAVTAENIKELQAGSTGEDIKTDAYRVSIPVKITGAKTVNDIQDGKQALSCGYTVDVEIKDGVWMGVPYQAIQRNIRYNHLAVVDRARAGDDAKLKMDSADNDIKSFGYQIPKPKQREDKPMLKKIKLDNGVEYEAEEKVIEAYTEAKTTLDEANAKLNTVNSEVTTLKTEKSELQAKHDTLEESNKTLKANAEKAKELDPKKVDEAVQARITLLTSAKDAGVEVKEDMSDMDIKKAVVLKVSPAAKEKLDVGDDIYVNARFDATLETLEKSDKEDLNNDKDLVDNLGDIKKEDTAEAHREKMKADMLNPEGDK